MKEYVLGLMYDYYDGYYQNILLIKKNKPEFQKGLLNGIGGKIEENELPINAMYREFEEETGISKDKYQTQYSFKNDWRLFSILEKENEWKVYCYCIAINIIPNFKSMTDEEVGVYSIKDIFENKYEIISNLKWLIEMSKDTDKKVLTIKYP